LNFILFFADFAIYQEQWQSSSLAKDGSGDGWILRTPLLASIHEHYVAVSRQHSNLSGNLFEERLSASAQGINKLNSLLFCI